MQKFENVDVIAALGEIMRQNTAFYQSDFNIDKGIIQRAAASDQAVDKTLLWMVPAPPGRTASGNVMCY